MTKKWRFIFLALPFCTLLFNLCENSELPNKITVDADKNSPYLNHYDSTRYVGINTCKQCHAEIYKSFIKTGMGQSFDVASKSKSSADFENSNVNDLNGNFNYHSFLKSDSLYINEFRLNKKDTIHSRIEQVNFIIGSGQHTNSHIQNTNGYLSQMPMTWYSQKKRWDLPPGFENGMNTHFSRKIGLECMSCHNAYSEFEKGSENKYNSVPTGIDCERCHGPGDIHVQQRQSQERIDTSKFIDYSIVNPAKLQVELQFDICQRCHLQGNAVLKEGKSFYDFKPGMKLNDYISVFLPKYKNADNEFIMASHADRLKQSACFIKSLPKENSKELKPYKNSLTCITCHNPHISVKETDKNVFNNACNNCHNATGKSKLECSEKSVKLARNSKQNLSNTKLFNCVSCHMPQSGSIDIPHVSVHDHYIRKPITKAEKEKIKEFVGLFSVNEKNPDYLTKAKAYINQYDKFEQNEIYLDSAKKLLKEDGKQFGDNLRTLIHLCFIKQDFNKIIAYVNKMGEDKCLNTLFVLKTYSNDDAWTCYRIAESNYYTNKTQNSLKWFKKAVLLAPFHLDFRNKLASVLASENKLTEAVAEYDFILLENPKYISAFSNLGFIKLKQGFPAEAIRLYNIGLKLNPDNEPLLLNLAGYYSYIKEYNKAITFLEKILKKNPTNQKAKEAIKQLKTLL